MAVVFSAGMDVVRVCGGGVVVEVTHMGLYSVYTGLGFQDCFWSTHHIYF